MRWDTLAKEDCSLARTLAVIGDRWTLLILRDAFLRVRRFDDFEKSLGIAGRVGGASILPRQPRTKRRTLTRAPEAVSRRYVDKYRHLIRTLTRHAVEPFNQGNSQ